MRLDEKNRMGRDEEEFHKEWDVRGRNRGQFGMLCFLEARENRSQATNCEASCPNVQDANKLYSLDKI